jgi:hypothetical protein
MDIADIGVTPDICYLLLGLIAYGWKSLLLTFGGIAIVTPDPWICFDASLTLT